MCGIAGVLGLGGREVSPEGVARAAELLFHRGPDQGAVWVSPTRRYALAVRRLAIIDRAGGDQPLKNEDGSIRLVYNGETYDAPERMAELEALGHEPGSRSDGEAILHGYEQWGAAGMLERVSGMLAMALWDEPRGRLLLARDRFGIKPLFWAEHAGCLLFASELRALLAIADLPRRVDPDALDALFTLGHVPAPATLLASTRKLPPAHFLLAERGGVRVERYWSVPWERPVHAGGARAVEEFRALLEDAVARRLRSEVPVGSLLSGGIDSSAVAAFAQAHHDGPLHTYSVAFPGHACDEAAEARETARALGVAHRVVEVGPTDVDRLPAVLARLGEPTASLTPIAFDRVFAACREDGRTVVLSGEGADELLGGYAWLRRDRALRPLLSLPGLLRRPLAWGLPRGRVRHVLTSGPRDPLARFLDWSGAGWDPLRPLRSPAEASVPRGAGWRAGFAEALAAAAHRAPHDQMLALLARGLLPDFLLSRLDRISMTHSIEARVPFLDARLWELCATLTPREKLGLRREKQLLRRAMRSRLPREVRLRRKRPFIAPAEGWLAAERLPEWAADALAPPALGKHGVFDPGAVDELLRQHRAGRARAQWTLPLVLSTQLWAADLGAHA